ncbi:hypothetical protein F4801DRAFT_572867 [Xylaria longipes]|nr:hypothetical protein F4801DRAFT_572867 [Xylaria longipes]
MGSLAPTAAYLLNSSSWDSEAEASLRRVMNCGGSELGVCSVITSPTTLFEVITALTSAGLRVKHIAAWGSSNMPQTNVLEQKSFSCSVNVCFRTPEPLTLRSQSGV